MLESYRRSYYENRYDTTVYSANTILSIILELLPTINSAVDIGCGVGTWLSVLQEKGIKDIQGVDGSWVDQDLLVIPQACFRQADLTTPTTLPRRYDLAISLEVAEHLPPDCAKGFVAMLADLADCVLFSAAIPRQGGRAHLNEQWPDYWAELFGALDYAVHDLIRPRIWYDSQIPFWYRQNTLLFCRRHNSENASLLSSGLDICTMPLNVVHPELYLLKANVQVQTGGKSRFSLFRSLQGYVTRRCSEKAGRGTV